MKVTKLKCKMAGKRITAVIDPECELACSRCSGIITVETKEVNGIVIKRVRLDVKTYATLPRIPLADFNCPATIPDPTKSDIVEVIE